ncbi:MAG: acyltransferase [Bacteroidetes bacterium]|nr:acyltransferase [Bacteroidota bacterium]
MTDTEVKPQNSGRIEFLDSARGLAAWSVLVFHTILIFNFDIIKLNPYLLAFLKMVFNGSEAVSFFFVLSGFVLASSLKDLKGNFSFPNYVVRRVFRIYPLYIVAVITAYFLAHDRVKIFALVQELLLTTGLHTLIPPGWTMGIEVVLSLLMPILILTLRQRQIFYVLLVITLFAYNFMSPFIFHFMLGVLVNDFYRAGKRSEWLDQAKYLALVIPVCILFYSLRQLVTVLPQVEYLFNLFQDIIGMQRDKIYFYFSGFASAVFILIILQSSKLQAILNHRFLAFIGKISFSLYLLHWIVIKAFHFETWAGYFSSAPVYLLTMIALVSVVTIAVSYFTYRFIELPFINLAKKVDLRNWFGGDAL